MSPSLFAAPGRLHAFAREPRGLAGETAFALRRTMSSPGSSVDYNSVALIVVFTAIVVLFKFQNLEPVSLFSSSITLPVSVLVLLIYLLGMLTGGFVLALLRSWVRGASQRPA